MPTASSAAPGLDALLAHRIAVAGRLVRARADAELVEVGVGAPACGVLLRLAGEDGLTQAEIARRQRVEAPTMCRTVDRLVRDGLVERRPDPLDRRATRVHLTDEGHRAAAAGAAVIDDIEARAFAALDDAERATLSELLGRVIDALAPSGGVPA